MGKRVALNVRPIHAVVLHHVQRKTYKSTKLKGKIHYCTFDWVCVWFEIEKW